MMTDALSQDEKQLRICDAQHSHLTYFTCTLGEAARWNEKKPHSFHTVNDLIDFQAENHGDRLAVYFPDGFQKAASHTTRADFTYRQLRDESIAAAERLGSAMRAIDREDASVVGLLCTSTPEFILAWLGLVRLGRSVMLLAPQLDHNAIKHLCHSLDISVVFADDRYFQTADELKHQIKAINISNVLIERGPEQGPEQDPHVPGKAFSRTPRPQDVAYLFHTSGTSSGLPKSIPQSHYAAVGVLPALNLGDLCATFSTTPLYHGGIADCLRAWASGAAIHLFPGTQPITSRNVIRAIEDADCHSQGAYRVGYFTSVPYILQMLATESPSKQSAEGMKTLQRMQLVGVGGAPLPNSLGDSLVSKGVKLVSRFGSAECGFLLSSHREYETDREWSWLRANPALQPAFYDFEPQSQPNDDDGPALFEFVVKPSWPHRGKTNRPDGSFATADLFERHPSIANAWRYHSRADAQITLSNGKKFDPAPVEGELLASEAGQEHLEDAMVFGTGRDAPGLLLLPRPSDEKLQETKLIAGVWPTVAKMNENTQSHARISRGSIVVSRIAPSNATALPKSSKGTIMRRQAENLFADDIERAYGDEAFRGRAEVSDSEVAKEMEAIFDDVLQKHVDPTVDLFSQGVDSIACAQLRKRIIQQLLPSPSQALPMNVIYDHGSVDKLTTYVLRCRNAEDGAYATEPDAYEDHSSAKHEMLRLAEKYYHIIKVPMGSFDQCDERIVVLTGATGLLGAHVLDLLLSDSKTTKIFCLVRAASPQDAEDRVMQALETRGLTTSRSELRAQSRVICLPSEPKEEKLGLDSTTWEEVAREATIIIHSAWPVNFALQLTSFEPQFDGLRNLLRLRDSTRQSAARFVFISSIAAVSAAHADDLIIPEVLSKEPDDASPLGYSRSKWVAEQICASMQDKEKAAQSPDQSTDSNGNGIEHTPVIIVRVGQLCGNKHGVWNRTEAYPLMLSSAGITGCLPALDEPLSWLPVDQAAASIIELCTAKTSKQPDLASLRTPVFHVLNRHQTPTWSDMMPRIVRHLVDDNVDEKTRAMLQGVKIVPAKEWLHRLEAALETTDHSARSLVPLWRSAYSQNRGAPAPRFRTSHADSASATMREVRPLDEGAVLQMWRWIHQSPQTA